MSLGENCMEQYIITHELFHVIGFFHEQSRWDRDDFITIYWDHMRDEVVRDQFKKVPVHQNRNRKKIGMTFLYEKL